MMCENSWLGSNFQLICPVLELWHPWKLLLETLWVSPQLYYPFWASFYHEIFPDAKVYLKPSLRDIDMIFTILRLAYPSVRTKVAGKEIGSICSFSSSQSLVCVR